LTFRGGSLLSPGLWP